MSKISDVYVPSIRTILDGVDSDPDGSRAIRIYLDHIANDVAALEARVQRLQRYSAYLEQAGFTDGWGDPDPAWIRTMRKGAAEEGIIQDGDMPRQEASDG